MRLRVYSVLSEEFEVKIGCSKDLCCHFIPFAVVIDVDTAFAREGALSELLYADDLVLIVRQSRDTVISL